MALFLQAHFGVMSLKVLTLEDALAELSWRTPPAAIVTVATFSVADRLYIGDTYIVLLWQDVLPSRLAAAFDHNRHLPPYLILCR